MDKFNSSSNDLELYSKLNANSYCIIKNAISNNYFSMSSRENVISDKSVIFIHINYSAEVENKFHQNHYLFHGSSIYSWYPIIKNGLKVMSGTALQANGAVYGKGIYFSDSFKLSLGYSQNRSINLNLCVVGVFEILEDPIKYNKSTNIFVIDDDTILLLRSLVITKNTSKISGDITNYFIKELPLQKKNNKLSISLLKNKRLDLEYKKILLDTNIIDIKIIDQTKWEIEFVKIKNNLIKIELIFSNYPISPPIIKMLSNIQINGLINQDGAIRIDLVNPTNWKLTNNLTEICSYLYNCFIETL
jgi:ubiquitin-protein ligase